MELISYLSNWLLFIDSEYLSDNQINEFLSYDYDINNIKDQIKIFDLIFIDQYLEFSEVNKVRYKDALKLAIEQLSDEDLKKSQENRNLIFEDIIDLRLFFKKLYNHIDLKFG